MFINKNFKNLSKVNQIKQLEIWISNLKDDDINRIILENKLNYLKNEYGFTCYKRKAKVFEVNH